MFFQARRLQRIRVEAAVEGIRELWQTIRARDSNFLLRGAELRFELSKLGPARNVINLELLQLRINWCG